MKIANLYLAAGAVLFMTGLSAYALKAPAAPAADVKLKCIYTDNMVLQREKPIVICGTAKDQGAVTVELNGKSTTVDVADNGTWKAELPEMKAGGPYTLKVSGQNSVELKNVMIGEVWVCSGQSNMEWNVKNSVNGDAEIAAANYPDIRIFHVKKDRSPTGTKEELVGEWKVCTPESIPNFSAVGYFFGRKLNKDLNVPVGLINSSWGGTMIEPWISRKGFESDPKYASIVSSLDKAKSGEDNKPEAPKVDEKLVNWQKDIETFYKKEIDACANSASGDLDDSSWKTMTVPGSFESNDINIDGVVWGRKTVELPASWAGKDLSLSLGALDDVDQTYFNGVKVGETSVNQNEFWALKRVYKVPGNLVKAGKNVIATRVFDMFMTGGMMGPSNLMKLENGKESIALAGEWKYKVEFAMDYNKVAKRPAVASTPTGNQFPTTLYNAMIHPFTVMPVRGVIWYQGESNAGNPDGYRDLYTTFVQDWRKAWNDQNMPFISCQLSAFYRHTPEKPMEPDFFAKEDTTDPHWARLREVQLECTDTIPLSGSAITIDIGNPVDIHPRNKQDVGTRLALIAEKMAYGKDISYSGPRYDKMTVEGNKIRLSFKHIDGGLVAKDGELKQFAIAGADKKFVWATAKIDGDTIVVSSDKVAAPVAVRYAWSMYPEGCNLYNKAGLPASPFRTDKW